MGGFVALATVFLFDQLNDTGPSRQRTEHSSPISTVGTSDDVALDSSTGHSSDELAAQKSDVARNAESEDPGTVLQTPNTEHKETPSDADLQWSPDDGMDRIEKTLFDLKSEFTDQK